MASSGSADNSMVVLDFAESFLKEQVVKSMEAELLLYKALVSLKQGNGSKTEELFKHSEGLIVGLVGKNRELKQRYDAVKTVLQWATVKPEKKMPDLDWSTEGMDLDVEPPKPEDPNDPMVKAARAKQEIWERSQRKPENTESRKVRPLPVDFDIGL